MKKYIYLLTALCALAFVGCNDDDLTYDSSSSIEILTSDKDFPTVGGQGVITYSIKAGNIDEVNVTKSKEWLTIDSATAGRIEFTVAESDDAFTRSGDITIALGDDKQTVTVLQSGSTFGFDGDGRTLDMDPTGVIKEMEYTSSGTLPRFSGVPEWLTITAKQDTENPRKGTITFEAGLNLTNALREATIEIENGWKKATVYVRQEAASGVTISNFGCDASACVSDPIYIAEYAVEALSNWNVSSNDSWFSVEKSDYSFTISVTENTTGENRVGKVELSNGNVVVATLVVNQTPFSVDGLDSRFMLQGNDAVYGMNIKKDLSRDNGLLACIMNNLGEQMSEGYSVVLDYLPYGEGAPKISMKLPQVMGMGINWDDTTTNMQISALTPDYYVATTECSFEFIYIGTNGSKEFKIVPGADALRLYPGGLGSFFFHPVGDYTGLILTFIPEYGGICVREWNSDGNHDGFTDI